MQNNATPYVKLGKKRRESSKRNYYIISRVSKSDNKSNHHHPIMQNEIRAGPAHSCLFVLYFLGFEDPT